LRICFFITKVISFQHVNKAYLEGMNKVLIVTSTTYRKLRTVYNCLLKSNLLQINKSIESSLYLLLGKDLLLRSVILAQQWAFIKRKYEICLRQSYTETN